MNKPTILFLFTFIFHSAVFAQIDTIYNLGNQRNRMTYEELQERIVLQENRIKNDTSDWYVRFEVTREKFKNDTLIQFGTIHLMETSILGESGKIESRLNKKMPEFDFIDINGLPIRSVDYEGKVILINFWFTRCPPCIAEMPHLNQIKEDYKDQEIAFISMAPETENQVKRFLKKHDFNFDHIPDADDFLKKFGVGFPKNILVDKAGIIRFIGNGLVGGYFTEREGEKIDKDQTSEKELRSMIDYFLAN